MAETEQKAEEKPAAPQAPTPPAPGPGPSETVDPKTQVSPQAQPGAPLAAPKQIPVVPYSRPAPSKAANETGGVIVAKTLAPQLLSDSRHLGQGIIDERKTAVLNEFTATALGYFSYRATVDKQRFWGHLVGWELVASQGIDGRGRRDALTALANASGVSTSELAKAPNLLARSIWNRDWKEKAEKEGKTVVE